MIITTVDHPFYVKEIGFVNASELSEGDILVDSEGREMPIASIVTEVTDEPVKVYNFQVEDYHTYFVGEMNVLVHNADYPKSPGEYEKASYHIIRGTM